MWNQKLKTELAYKSAKSYTLRQCGVITDLPHFIHKERGILFVDHKAITVRTNKISLCSSHILFMYNPISTGVSQEGRKITTTSKHLTTSFCAQRNRYKTDKITFLYFKNIHFGSNQWLSNAVFVLCLPFVDPLCETGNSSPGCLCLTTSFAFN